MTPTLLSVFGSFVLVTIIGGIFVQSLQHRNWIRQQHITNQDKLISELKSIFIELDNLLSRRLYRTRRLLYALRRKDSEKIKTSLQDYDAVLCEWNDKRNSFQIRLVRVISVALANNFEHELSRRFVRIGSQLERLTRSVSVNDLPAGFHDTLSKLEIQLDLLSRSIYEFLREIYKRLQAEQQALYYIDRFIKVPENIDEIDHISSWYLFKALFVPPTERTEES